MGPLLLPFPLEAAAAFEEFRRVDADAAIDGCDKAVDIILWHPYEGTICFTQMILLCS